MLPHGKKFLNTGLLVKSRIDFSVDICIATVLPHNLSDVDLLILVSACQNPLRAQDVCVLPTQLPGTEYAQATRTAG